MKFGINWTSNKLRYQWLINMKSYDEIFYENKQKEKVKKGNSLKKRLLIIL